VSKETDVVEFSFEFAFDVPTEEKTLFTGRQKVTIESTEDTGMQKTNKIAKN
jgi:hypothetical protein